MWFRLLLNFPVCPKARNGVDVETLDDMMLYLDSSFKPVVTFPFVIYSFVQMPIKETFMKVAIDLGKYHISDNHVQLLETSVRRLGRVGLVPAIINETFPEYSFCPLHPCSSV